MPHPPEVTSFYRHLVGFLAVELAVLVVAYARDDIAGWAWALLLGSGLALAAHAAVAFRPPTGPDGRGTPVERNPPTRPSSC